MFGYVVRQLVSKFLTVVLTSMFVFALFGYGPNDPAAVICQQNGRCTQQRLALLNHSLGLDQPVTKQYETWVKGIFVSRTISTGPGAHYKCPAPCLGISYVTYQPVRQQLIKHYPATISLAIGAAVVELLVGLLLGSMAARWRGSAADRTMVTGSLILNSIPYYVLALVCWLYLINSWGIFPQSGYHPITRNVGAWFSGLLLPWLVLGIVGSTQYARFGRGEMVTALGEDFTRTATAKGVSSMKVIFKHAFRAAIVPIVTLFGLDFAYLLSGTFFTEYIFNVNGVGLYTLNAIQQLDYPIIAAAVLVTAILIVVANLIVDVLYSVIDPRVRLA